MTRNYDKLIFVGRNVPRRYPRGYRWALTWGYVTFSDDDGITYTRERFCVTLGRANGRTLWIFKGPSRLVEDGAG